MTWAAWAALAACCAALAPARGCELVLAEQRSQHELMRVPLAVAASQRPELRVAFTHSVLGTAVIDRYEWRDAAWVLLEERFEGEGYGLAHDAEPGQQLQREGPGWRLTLQRRVQPLVVRPLPAQHMRLLLEAGRELPLGPLSRSGIHIRAEGC